MSRPTGCSESVLCQVHLYFTWPLSTIAQSLSRTPSMARYSRWSSRSRRSSGSNYMNSTLCQTRSRASCYWRLTRTTLAEKVAHPFRGRSISTPYPLRAQPITPYTPPPQMTNSCACDWLCCNWRAWCQEIQGDENVGKVFDRNCDQAHYRG